MNSQSISLNTFYSQPSIESLNLLDDNDFLLFINQTLLSGRYALQRISQNLHSIYYGAHLTGILYISFATERAVGKDTIDVLRAEQIRYNVPGFLITRTDFTDEAYDTAGKQIFLITGRQLFRYFTYLQVTRANQALLPPILPDVIAQADMVRTLLQSTPHVIAISNNRGGIGKSTTALNLAYGLYKENYRVLAIDLDPQANFTEILCGKDAHKHFDHHIGDYFNRNKDSHGNPLKLASLVQPTQFKQGVAQSTPKICLIPSHPNMRKFGLDVNLWQKNQLTFAADLHNSSLVYHPFVGQHGFDWIIIDTPPDMGFYTQAALTAANYIIAPTTPSIIANHGIEVLLDTANELRLLIGDENHAKLLGFIATRYTGKQKMIEDYRAVQVKIISLLTSVDNPFFNVEIPETSRVDMAIRELIGHTGNTSHIDLFKKEGDAGQAYRKITQEVIAHVSPRNVS